MLSLFDPATKPGRGFVTIQCLSLVGCRSRHVAWGQHPMEMGARSPSPPVPTTTAARLVNTPGRRWSPWGVTCSSISPSAICLLSDARQCAWLWAGWAPFPGWGTNHKRVPTPMGAQGASSALLLLWAASGGARAQPGLGAFRAPTSGQQQSARHSYQQKILPLVACPQQGTEGFLPPLVPSLSHPLPWWAPKSLHALAPVSGVPFHPRDTGTPLFPCPQGTLAGILSPCRSAAGPASPRGGQARWKHLNIPVPWRLRSVQHQESWPEPRALLSHELISQPGVFVVLFSLFAGEG